ncbi:MAG: hypothetical protein RR340_08120, partial [Cloacibacillus sp.]
MNIQKIQAQVEVVLDGYNVDYSHSQIKALVGQWYLAKEDLISVLRNHPNWNEDDLAVAFNADIERKIDVDAFYHELNKLKTAHAIDYETFCGLYPLCATTLVDDSNGLVFKDNGVRVQKGMKMPRAI